MANYWKMNALLDLVVDPATPISETYHKQYEMMSMRSFQGLPGFQGSAFGADESITYQTPAEIEEIKGIFAMLDGDDDGVITESDLSSMLRSVGLDNSPANLKKMLSVLQIPLDFPAFLTYITSLKSHISSREELVSAFTSFDDHDSGYIDADILRNDLTTTGPQRMTDEQVNTALRGFVEKTGKHKGKIAYNKFLDTVAGERPFA